MKFREFYEETIETGKTIFWYSVLAGAVCSIGYLSQQYRSEQVNRKNSGKLALITIMMASSENKDSNGGVIEIREIGSKPSGLEDKASGEAKTEKRE